MRRTRLPWITIGSRKINGHCQTYLATTREIVHKLRARLSGPAWNPFGRLRDEGGSVLHRLRLVVFVVHYSTRQYCVQNLDAPNNFVVFH